MANMLVAREKVTMHVNKAIASTIPRKALDDLNWMRGLAAVAVLAGHVRGAFFVELTPKSSAIAKAVYLLTGFGHQAVIVFFVLSGFFIGTSVVVTTRDGSWSWKRFALRRVTRLYVVLIPALLLTALWDSLGTGIFGLRGIYVAHINAPLLSLPDLRKSFNAPVLLGNLAFLQDFRVVPFGSNTPLWSLSYEFWAYLVFPLLFRAAFGDGSIPLRAVSALAGAALVLILGGEFPFYLGLWSLGATVAIGWSFFPVAIGRPLLPAASFAILTGALLVARGRVLHLRHVEDFALALATALFVAVRLAVASARGDHQGNAPLSQGYSRAGELLAGFSYTLYAAHYPAVAFFQAWLVGDQRWTADLGHVFVATAVGTGIIVLYAYPLSLLTEARTDDVRRWLERRSLREAHNA